MQHLLPLLVLFSASIAGSVPVRPVTNPLDADLSRARSEASAAEQEAKRLTEVASQQRDAADRLRIRQEAAAQAIAAAEAQISAADAESRLLSAKVATQRDALRRQRAPASALMGGLAMMAQRPPLLALADQDGTDEFVRVRLLLDSTLPIIRERTAALSGQIVRGTKLEAQLAAARQGALARRTDLQAREREFAALEQQTLRSAEQSGSAALGAGDIALSRGETGQELAAALQRGQSAARIAAEVAALGSPPARPFAPEGGENPALDYRLPAEGAVSEGFGSVSENGIRARGITIATRRGVQVFAPANGIILFAGPYRSHDGIIIIDHGDGWKSLILNAATDMTKGSTVRLGQPIGRSLGPIGAELSRNGQYLSPALIAGSSATLSKSGKSR